MKVLFFCFFLQNQIGFKAKEAIQRRYGTQYAVGSIADVLCKMRFGLRFDFHSDFKSLFFYYKQILPPVPPSTGFMVHKMFLSLTCLNFAIDAMVILAFFLFSIVSNQLKNYIHQTGRHGFVLPANQILPNSLEVLDGVKAMLKEAKLRSYL